VTYLEANGFLSGLQLNILAGLYFSMRSRLQEIQANNGEDNPKICEKCFHIRAICLR